MGCDDYSEMQRRLPKIAKPTSAPIDGLALYEGCMASAQEEMELVPWNPDESE